jgi:mRNA interferase MazF
LSKAPYLPDRGDIVWLILDPRVGHEQSGRRPVLVLSPRLFTERTGLAVICPITSKAKGLPFEIELRQTKTNGAVLPIHVRSVDVKVRKAQFIEKAPPKVLTKTAKSVEAIIGQM